MKQEPIFLTSDRAREISKSLMPVLGKSQDIARSIFKHIGCSRPGDACFHPKWRMVVGSLDGLKKATAYEIIGVLQDEGIIDMKDKDWKYSLDFPKE